MVWGEDKPVFDSACQDHTVPFLSLHVTGATWEFSAQLQLDKRKKGFKEN